MKTNHWTKTIGVLLLSLGLFKPTNGFAQTLSIQSGSTISTAQSDSIVQIAADSQGLAQITPADLPIIGGTFWWVMPGGAAVPTPCLPLDLSGAIYQIAENQFLVDETGGQVVVNTPRFGLQAQATSSTVASKVASQADAVVNLITQVQTTAANQQVQAMAGSMMDMGVPTPGDGGGGGTYTPAGSSYTPPNYGTNLWLACIAVSNNIFNGLIHNSSPLVPYTLFSMQSLTWPAWNAEATFYGSGITNFTSFAVPRLGRNMLFLRARSQFASRIIGAGSSHNVVIRRDGTVWAWGSNGNGQLGNGQWTGSSVPVQVTGLSNIVALSVAPDDSFTLALDANGKVWSWGANGSGQLGRGDGLYQDTNIAALVPALSNIVAIAGGSGHAIALRSDGTVWAWGGNDYGDLGDGSGTGRDHAAPVPGLTNMIGIASGDYHNFALCANGKVWGWGLNEVAELGIGNEDDQPQPVLVSALTNAVALSGGYLHSIALLADGTVKAWGENYYGEIGNLSSFTPVPVSGLSNILAIACGGYHNLFLDQSGRIFVLGNDYWGQLGDGGAGSTVPFLLTSVSNVTAIAGGGTSSMISTADGSIYTWGSSYESQALPTLMDLYANYSSDGSGLPDWWEIKYFGHLGVDTNADSDGDGWNNLQEYQNGTNPTNFDTPSAVTGLTATQNTNSIVVTLTWNAETPTPANYIIYRTDYNYDTWQYGAAQQIGEVAGNITSFVDNGNVSSGDGNSIYAIDAVYLGGTSPVSGQTYINSITPAALTPAQPLTVQLVRNATGRWQLMFGSLPSDVQTLRLYWNETVQDITPANLNNGVYQIPDADVVNVLGDTVSVEAIATNGTTSATVQAGTIPNDAPYFVDGRQHMKQNLTFIIRGASDNAPFFAEITEFRYFTFGYSGFFYDSYVGEMNQSSTNFEEFSFLHHGSWNGGAYEDLSSYQLDNLWPFTINYDLVNYFVDTTRTNPTPFGSTNFTFQPNFAINIPAPAMLTHADPYWILQPAFVPDYTYYGVSVPTPTNWSVTVTSTQTVASLASGSYNFFGLPYETGCEVDMQRAGFYSVNCLYQALISGGSVTANQGYLIGDYANWCPAPTLQLVNYYFVPLFNPNLNPMGLPGAYNNFWNNGIPNNRGIQPFTPLEDDFNVTNQTPAVMFGAVGQPMILGSWAKYSVQGSSPTKFAYLGQYFTTNAFKVNTNGVITTTKTGVVSPYGEFFPTEPGPVAMITMPDIDTGMQATGIVQVISLALDANHDGTIDTTFNGPDFVSANHPYRFWVNGNYDRWNYDSLSSTNEQDDVASTDSAANSPYTGVSTPDFDYRDIGGNRVIPCTRDLEDFTRLWVCGLTSNLVASLPSGSTVTLSWGDVGNPNPNNPTIDLFTAADAGGGAGYLTNETTATIQIDPVQSPYIGRLAPGGSIQLNANYFGNTWRGNHFIWCGVSNGTGGLALTIMDAHSNILAKTSTYIQLVDIKQMYERWTVGDDPSQPPAVIAQIATNDLPSGVIWPFQYANPGNANTPYILLVHGWNLETWAKDRELAETAFKRLYWQGYQGRFGTFRWPTDYGITGTLTAILNSKTFDSSEFRAWNSAIGLLHLLTRLNIQYPGQVYLMAHSHGNVVAGEALRLAGTNQLVNTYVAMQAAVPAHCYDPTATSRALNSTGFNLDSGTSNRYAIYYTSGATNYFNGSAGAGTCVNFYNIQDWALTQAWEPDQDTKPDTDYSSTTTNGVESYAYIGGFGTQHLYFPQDTYQIFSYIIEARCYALGAQPDMGGVFKKAGATQQVNLEALPYSFGNQHIYHSGEFRSDNAQRWQFWRTVLQRLDLTP